MNKLLLFLFFLLAFTECKKEDRDPLPEVASIVGKWRVVEYRKVESGSTKVEPVDRKVSWVYEIRFDGVILNENGYKPCCLPPGYRLNGREFIPEPAMKAEPDPICASSLCVSCPEMKITQRSPDSIIIEQCPGVFYVYAREK